MPLLDILTKEYYKSGLKPKSTAARAWFVETIRQYNINPSNILRGEPSTPVSLMGNMFFFRYDAKYKEVLPYWDKFPLVIPIEFYPDSFLGINLHYLGYSERAVLLDKIASVSGAKYIDEGAKLRATYQMVKESTKFREVQPCIKKYLYSHVKSQFVKVEPKQWEVAIFLPVQQFVGAKAEDIWEGKV